MSIFLKVLAIVVTFAGAVFAAGLTGVLFRVWPTSWPDQQLRVTDSEIAALQRLRAVPKFYPDTKLFYPGAAEEVTRAKCEALINDLLSELIVSVKTTPRKSRVLLALKATLSNASRLDTEEQDRLGSYLEETLRILDIDSSNELINVWRYGFPYGWYRSSEPKARARVGTPYGAAPRKAAARQCTSASPGRESSPYGRYGQRFRRRWVEL